MKWNEKYWEFFQQERSGTMSWDREDEGDDRLIYDKNICWKFDMERKQEDHMHIYKLVL